MSSTRILRRFFVPAAGTVKVVGAGFVVGAAVRAGMTEAQAALGAGVVLPGLAVTKGLFDMMNGLLFWLDTNEKEPLKGHYHGIDARGFSVLSFGGEDNPKPFDRFKYSPNERRIRGLFQALSGLFLYDGGVEAFYKDSDLLHFNNLAGSHSLLWRMAISSYVDFAMSLHDLYKALRHDRNKGTHPYTDAYDPTCSDFCSELLIKGLNAAGWTALAIGGPIGLPLGMFCLAAATMITLLKHHEDFIPYTVAFFSNIKSGCSDESHLPVATFGR